MSEKKIIAATLQVDTANANANVKDFNSNVNTAKNSLNDIGTTASKTGTAIDGTSGSFGKLKGQMSALPGPLGQASDGVGKLSSGFKALLANPVVLLLTAIVGALALLYKAFTSTAEGADKVAFVFDGVKAVALTVRDTILNVAGAIGKFFSGDFKGAMEDGKKAVEGFGDKCVESFNRAYTASKMLDDIEDRMKELDVAQARSNFLLKESKQILMDETASYDDKVKAIEKVTEAENKAGEERSQNAVKALMVIQQQNDEQRRLGTLSQDQIDKEQQAEITAYNLKTEHSNNLTALQKQRHTLDKQQASERKAISDKQREQDNINLAAAKQNKKELDDLNEADFRKTLGKTDLAIYDLEQKHIREQVLLKKNHADTLLNEKLFRDELSKIILGSTEMEVAVTTAATGTRIKLDDGLRERVVGNVVTMGTATRELNEAQVKWQEMTTEEKLNAIGSELDKFSENIGKQTAAGKAAAIAAATISTYQSAVSSFNSLSGIPIVGPALGAIAAGAAIVNGINTVKKIIAVKVPGGGAGGSAPSATSITMPAAPIAPRATSTMLPQDQINQIGSAAGPQNIQAYVVESQGADARERTERLNRQARLG